MGIAATLVYAIVSAVGNEAFAITPVFASIIGQVASAGVSYFGHSLFSFRVKTNHQAYLLRFLIIAAIMFALNSAVTWLIADVLKLSPRIAIATVASSFQSSIMSAIGFGFSRRVRFRQIWRERPWPARRPNSTRVRDEPGHANSRALGRWPTI